MDISAFDFELDEVAGVISWLPGLADTVKIELRLHDLEEDEEVHAKREEPTFRIQCRLLGVDFAIHRLVVLATEMGLEAVLDDDRAVRFRHSRQDGVAS